MFLFYYSIVIVSFHQQLQQNAKESEFDEMAAWLGNAVSLCYVFFLPPNHISLLINEKTKSVCNYFFLNRTMMDQKKVLLAKSLIVFWQNEQLLQRVCLASKDHPQLPDETRLEVKTKILYLLCELFAFTSASVYLEQFHYIYG